MLKIEKKASGREPHQIKKTQEKHQQKRERKNSSVVTVKICLADAKIMMLVFHIGFLSVCINKPMKSSWKALYMGSSSSLSFDPASRHQGNERAWPFWARWLDSQINKNIYPIQLNLARYRLAAQLLSDRVFPQHRIIFLLHI